MECGSLLITVVQKSLIPFCEAASISIAIFSLHLVDRSVFFIFIFVGYDVVMTISKLHFSAIA